MHIGSIELVRTDTGVGTDTGVDVYRGGEYLHSLTVEQVAERLTAPVSTYWIVRNGRVHAPYDTQSAAQDAAADARSVGDIAYVVELSAGFAEFAATLASRKSA